MRALKIVTITMAVMIVVATIALGVLISRRLGGIPPQPVSAMLDEPAGTHIAAIAALTDRLAVQLQGGGPDRVIFLDSRTLTRIGGVALAH